MSFPAALMLRVPDHKRLERGGHVCARSPPEVPGCREPGKSHFNNGGEGARGRGNVSQTHWRRMRKKDKGEGERLTEARGREWKGKEEREKQETLPSSSLSRRLLQAQGHARSAERPGLSAGAARCPHHPRPSLRRKLRPSDLSRGQFAAPTRRGPGFPVRSAALRSPGLGPGRRGCGVPRRLRVRADPGEGTGRRRALPGSPAAPLPRDGDALVSSRPARLSLPAVSSRGLKPVGSGLSPSPSAGPAHYKTTCLP